MTATEYFDKYDQIIFVERIHKGSEYSRRMLMEMSQEAVLECQKRKGAKVSSVISVLREFDQKWNAVCNLYDYKYGVCPIGRNDFKEYWKHILPEIKDKL